MKLLRIYLPFLFIMFISCNEFDNHGYPGKVFFPKEGGEVKVSGYADFRYLSIGDKNDQLGNAEGRDSLIVSFEWLTAKQKIGGDTLVIIASPMESEKSRKEIIRGSFGRTEAEIMVYQGK